MGLFKFKEVVTIQEELEEVFEDVLEEPEFKIQVTGFLIFVTTLFFLRLLIHLRLKKLNGEKIVDVSALDRANLAKEVFLAYLNAALLEPVLTLSSMEELETPVVIIEALTFGSLCWWIWLVSDAFSFEDVWQKFKYSSSLREELLQDSKKFPWIHIKANSSAREEERDELNGDLKVDVALWFMLACIFSAWLPGAITHAQAIHAYVVVILWIFLHHCCYQATHWGMGYFLSFFFPSASLMPLEYCLPLMDMADFVEDLDAIANYREWVKERTGVELIIHS